MNHFSITHVGSALPTHLPEGATTVSEPDFHVIVENPKNSFRNYFCETEGRSFSVAILDSKVKLPSFFECPTCTRYAVSDPNFDPVFKQLISA